MAKLPRHHHLWHRASSTSSSRSAAAAVALSRRALQAYASQLQPAPAYTQRQASQQQSDEATAGVDDWEWTPSPSTANDVDHLIASTSAVTLEDLPRAVRLGPVPRPRLLWSSSPLSYSSSSSSSVAPTSASFSTSAPSRVTLQWLDPNPPEIVRTWTRSNTRHPSSSSRPSSPPDRTLPPADFDFAHHNHQSGNSFDLSEADVLSAAAFAASSSYHGANGGSSSGGGSHGGGSGSHGGSSSSSSSDGNGYTPGDVPPTLASTTGQPARAHSPSSSSSTFDRHHSQAQAPIPPPILASSPSSARPHTSSIVGEASAAQPSASRTITLHHHHNHHDHSFAPLYEFRHGAYGIPKRHPLAAQKKKAAASASSSRGMLAAAADFLTGPVSAEPPPPPPRPAEEKQKSASPSPPAQQQQKLDPDTLRSVQVGEDSYFLRSDSFGIADGVGGWATRPGANPALFSRLLMHFCSVELSRYDEVMQMQGRKDRNRSEREEELVRAFWEVDPVEVMHRAWERCVRISRREGILGSSTALLAMLRGDELRIANLGDCVLLIVRRGHLLFRSQEQQHSFNFPVQLGMKLKRGEQRGGSVETDRREAEKTPVQVTAASLDEDLDAVEDEAGLLEQRRKSEEEARKASVEARRFEEEERQRERDERRRRAEFEGKDMALFDAELEAGKDFDFDPNSGGAATAGKNGQQEAQEEDGEEEGSRSTVYIGFDDSHPWDEPRRDCGRWTIQVQQGDVIILASDGLVDNLFDDDILEEVQRFAPPLDDIEAGGQGQEDAATTAGVGEGDEWPPTDFSPQLLSEALCSRAKAVSQDSKAVISPFQQRATEEGLPYVGGKHDDISVLVAVVVGEAEGRLRLKR